MPDTQPLSPHAQHLLARLRGPMRVVNDLFSRVKLQNQERYSYHEELDQWILRDDTPHVLTADEVTALLAAATEIRSIRSEITQHCATLSELDRSTLNGALVTPMTMLETCCESLTTQLGARFHLRMNTPHQYTAVLPALHAMITGSEPGRRIKLHTPSAMTVGKNAYRWVWRAVL